jgi:hypothetical protein
LAHGLHLLARTGGQGQALIHGLSGGLQIPLDRREQGSDLLGLLGGAFRQLADLLGDHGEATARRTGMGRLDGRVQAEQAGAGGDLLDDPGDLRHLEDLLHERLDAAVGDFGLPAEFPDVRWLESEPRSSQSSRPIRPVW